MIMLIKKALIITSSAVLALCFTGCNNEGSQKKDYDIVLTAEFNEDTNSIDTVLENNTGDLAVFRTGERSIYKDNGGKWEEVSFSYSSYSTETFISPKDGENTYEASYAAYPSTNEDGNSIGEAQNTKYLESGSYKITVPITVCDPTEYLVSDDGTTTDLVDSEKNRVDIEVEALFTVE